MSGGMECIALAFGPLISGAVARYSEWRISFYIIIPVGAVVILSVFFFVHNIQRPEHVGLPNREKLRRLDVPGFAAFVPLAICVILALEWGGSEYMWNNWRLILLWTLAGVLLVVFLGLEYRSGEDSMFPLNLLYQRSVAFSALFTFCNSAALFVTAYYVSLVPQSSTTNRASNYRNHQQLPIYFQAVRDATTFESGLMYLPSAVPFALAILAAGPVTSFIGYYTPVMVAGSILMVIAASLFTTFSPTTPPSEWISYQVLYGIGVGLAFQQPYTAVQTVLPDSTVPTALVVLSFTQEIGGIVALSIAQNMFTNRLASNLVTEMPGIHPKSVLRHGVLGIIKVVPENKVDVVKSAYNDAIVDVFYLAVALTGLTVLASLLIEWRSVKEENGNGQKKNENVVHIGEQKPEEEKREQRIEGEAGETID